MLRLALLLGVAASTGVAAIAPLAWTPVAPGVERVAFPLGQRGMLASVEVIALRVAPCHATLSLEARTRFEGLRGAWTIDSMGPEAILAFNGGQFRDGTPWGWIVRDGVEQQAPGTGALAMGVVLDDGAVRLLRADEIESARGAVRHAIQSYPALVIDGAMPFQLRAPGRGVDLEHRDSRLAIGTDREGRLLVVLTRFRGVAGVGSSLPLGPTIPELARVMQRLGAVRAVGLDGGISSQLAVRSADGSLERHTNWRMVPMGVVARARTLSCHPERPRP
jgi:uncharacterized protein YigE (DUF2233 family)